MITTYMLTCKTTYVQCNSNPNLAYIYYYKHRMCLNYDLVMHFHSLACKQPPQVLRNTFLFLFLSLLSIIFHTKTQLHGKIQVQYKFALIQLAGGKHCIYFHIMIHTRLVNIESPHWIATLPPCVQP